MTEALEKSTSLVQWEGAKWPWRRGREMRGERTRERRLIQKEDKDREIERTRREGERERANKIYRVRERARMRQSEIEGAR